MSFSITPIGVNDAFTVTGLETNFLLSDGEEKMLVDCGTTAARALKLLGIELADLDRVYLSHLHLDHAGGLLQLGIQRYFRGLPRPQIYLHHQLIRPLWENFLKGPLEYFTDRDGRQRQGQPDIFFDLRPLSGSLDDLFTVGPFSLRAFPVVHVPGMASHGLVVEDRVVLTTDTIFMPELIEDLANRFAPEAVFHDCAFREHLRRVHATYEQLLTLPEDLRALLYLVHYEDGIEPSKLKHDLLAEAGRIYSYD